jgi:copper transport protein
MNSITVPSRVRRVLAVAAGIIAIGAMAAPHAYAVDNTLVTSNPLDGSTIAQSPPTLSLTFANPLGSVNRVQVACNGAPVAVGEPQLGVDGLSLTVTVPNPLPSGTCTVVWVVSQPDSQPGGSSSFSFAITNDTAAPAAVTPVPGSTPAGGTAAPTVTAAGSATTGTDATKPESGSGGPLGLSRLLVSLGVAVLFGSLVLIATAWPEGVEYILTVRFLRSAWLMTLAFAIFNAACVAARISGDGIGSSLSPTSWGKLTDTTPGVAALARVLFVALTGWVVMRPERVIDPTTQLPGLALPGLAVATLGFSRAGGQLALLGYAAGIAHALAMAVWLGGLVLLARVVLAGPGEEDLVHAVRGFARISMPALVVTIFTGFIQMYRLDWGEIFDSSHGRVLFLKAIAVGVMVFLGVAARQFIKERVARVDAMTGQLALRLRRAVGIEAVCGVVVLAITAWLLSLTPSKVVATDTSTARDLPAVAHFVSTDGAADVTVKFSGVVGANAVRVEVVKPVTGVAALAVSFTPPVGSPAASVVLNVPLVAAGVAMLPLDQGLPIGAPGVWTVAVNFGPTVIATTSVLITNGNSPGLTTPTSATTPTTG